jgi:cell division protease FtsH
VAKLNKQQLKNKPHKKKRVVNFKRICIIIIFIVYIIIAVISGIKDSREQVGDITLNEFYTMIEDGEVKDITLNKTDGIIYIHSTDGKTYETINPNSDTFLQEIMEKGVDVAIQKESTFDSILTILSTLPMMIIVAMLAVYLANTIMGASTKMFTLVKSENNHTTFNDVKGMGRTKQEVQYIILQLRNWRELGRLGARPCKGMLFFGPPGVGKTLLAKAIAKEAGVAFISCSGSDFDEVFVGVGAGRIRSLFELAAVNAPCIIFIDEIDCVGRRRRGGDGASQDHNQTLNALLQRMDGLNDANGILVIGATNRKEDLDSALTRPGRFDRHFYVGIPDNKDDRDELVEFYLSNKQIDEGVTLEKVSKLMVGLSGAEVEEALNSAVYISLEDGRGGILQYRDIDEAIMQLHTDGVAKNHSSKHDEEIASVHEAGHTLVSLLQNNPISKVSNIPYSSGMGGVTMTDLDIRGDQKFRFESDYINEIKMLLAGKCAEEITYGEHTQGCCNDIEVATRNVYNMISSFAFDNNNLSNENTLIEMGVSKEIQNETKDKCKIILSKLDKEVTETLINNKERLLALRDMLIEQKTIVQPTLEMLDKAIEEKHNTKTELV